MHFRTLLEEQLAASDVPLAIIDVDFKNYFPLLEWESIRAAVLQLRSGFVWGSMAH